MKVLNYISRNFLRGRFLIAAAAVGMLAGVAAEEGRKAFSAKPDPEKDRITAVFSPAGDPALGKPYYGARENEIAWLQRHHEMMKDTANVRELKEWLSKNFDSVLDSSRMHQIETARKVVQKHLTYAYDERVYGRNYVAAPLQTLRARQGDCDDYSALYYIVLRYMGFPDNKCFELILGTNGGVGNHRVVLADTSGADETRLLSKNLFILDNGGGLKHLEQTDFVPGVLINRSGSHLVTSGIDSVVNEARRDIKNHGLVPYIKKVTAP